MAATRGGRTQTCGPAEARIRVAQARNFLETADLITGEDDDLATPGTAAALAVLAGIAAADALCCMNLGQRSRGQDHCEAARLVEQVEPNGRALSRSFSRLLTPASRAPQFQEHSIQPRACTNARRKGERLGASIRAGSRLNSARPSVELVSCDARPSGRPTNLVAMIPAVLLCCRCGHRDGAADLACNRRVGGQADLRPGSGAEGPMGG